MQILIAEDDPASRTLVAALVRKLGHQVLLVPDGEQAVYAFATQRPDLVLMDGQMPLMDGLAATRRIRELSGEHWTPILFIAAEHDRDVIVRAFEAGADDYMVKPVHPAILRAKLDAIARVHALYSEGEAQKARLQYHLHAAGEEGRIALHLMQKLVNAEQLDDPLLQTIVVPLNSTFSGDLVAAARTPCGALHVMLADAVGHGLAAALNVLPIVPNFYAMTGRGFDLDMIAIELNRTLRHNMPVDRFVATTLIAVDVAARRIRVWNGGNPPVLLLAHDGAVLARFDSKNMAIGILPEAVFEPVIEVFDYAVACQLFACSDGVIEDYGRVSDGVGRQQGVEHMLAETPPALRLKRLRSALAARTSDSSVGDDMTVLLIDCDPLPPVALPLPPRAPAGWRFEASFDADNLRAIDVPAMLIEVLSVLPGACFHRRPLGVLMAELFNQVVDHGLLGLSGPSGKTVSAAQHRVRAAALAQLAQGAVAVCLRTQQQAAVLLLECSFRAVDGHAAHGGWDDCLEWVRACCASVEVDVHGDGLRATYALTASLPRPWPGA